MNPFGGVNYRQIPTQKPVRNPFETNTRLPQKQEVQTPAQFQQPESPFTLPQKKLLAERPGTDAGHHSQNQWHAASQGSFWGGPTQRPKADRSIAIGLNKRFLGTTSGQEEQNNPFLMHGLDEDAQSKPNIFEPCPHFLAEA